MDEETPLIDIPDHHEEIFQQLQNQIDQVLAILNDDANKLLQRHGSLQRLENKAESLLRKTKEFKRTTKKLQCRLWMKDKAFCITCITILVFVLLLIMIIVFYGITAHDLDKEDVQDK